jgi:lipopolysaccharide transport system ATP-binding protein
MGDIAIRADSLSKKYRIGERASRTLRESLAEGISATFRPSAARSELREFWALREVSFEVKRGEIVGIVGRNGAGKSTLLKVLSRITQPTSGYAVVYGRVRSLLEVGTGFHQELTGRENVYLNGAILGMKRNEIDRRFDEIVAFAEVEAFIDLPVKHYSSGMSVRLAFAVAAYLEPEILILDEVLAVGDAAFQRKCLGKMDRVAQEGRTVLFVSHDLVAVQNLCEQVIVLAGGKIECKAPATEALATYLAGIEPLATSANLLERQRQSQHTPIIAGVDFVDDNGRLVQEVPTGGAINVHIHYRNDVPIRDPFFGLRFVTPLGNNIVWVQSRLHGSTWDALPAEGTIICSVPHLPLLPGRYHVAAGCGSREQLLDLVERSRVLDVVAHDYFGTGRLPNSADAMVIVDASWREHD